MTGTANALRESVGHAIEEMVIILKNILIHSKQTSETLDVNSVVQAVTTLFYEINNIVIWDFPSKWNLYSNNEQGHELWKKQSSFLYYIFIRVYYTKLGQVVYLSDIDSNGMKASF